VLHLAAYCSMTYSPVEWNCVMYYRHLIAVIGTLEERRLEYKMVLHSHLLLPVNGNLEYSIPHKLPNWRESCRSEFWGDSIVEFYMTLDIHEEKWINQERDLENSVRGRWKPKT
jgi:hypothetical protein